MLRSQAQHVEVVSDVQRVAGRGGLSLADAAQGGTVYKVTGRRGRGKRPGGVLSRPRESEKGILGHASILTSAGSGTAQTRPGAPRVGSASWRASR